MESPKQTEETMRERSRNPSPDTSQSGSHSEDGLERIGDPDVLGRFDTMVAKTEATALPMGELLVTCAGVEREVNAYHERVGTHQGDHQRMNLTEGGELHHRVLEHVGQKAT